MSTDESDNFQGFKKDPRLQTEKTDTSDVLPSTGLSTQLESRLMRASDQQDIYDELRLFKREQVRHIAKLENNPLQNRKTILKKITVVAETILISGFKHVQKKLETDMGIPSYLTSYKQVSRSHLAIVGMGKLGAGEMDYESDLDLIFIYSHQGDVIGKKRLTNREYFAKFAQRLIQMLSVMTGAGRCYEIDVELRPSGQGGALVSTFDHFIEHQMNRAEDWERMALLRSRPVVAPTGFAERLMSHLDTLTFTRPIPKDFFAHMNVIRERVLNERVQEPDGCFDLKLGRGGLMDIDFVLQGLQLKYQKLYPDLRKRSLFDLMDAFRNHSIISVADLKTLSGAHILYRTVLAQLHLIEKRALSLVKFDSDTFLNITARLPRTGRNELIENLNDFRKQVRSIYEHHYQNP